MKIEYFEAFEQAQRSGLKKQAAASVQLFVESFRDEDEIARWVWSYLASPERNQGASIRHELFTQLIYPTLKKGYDAGDLESTLWMGKLSQNIYRTPELFEELGFMTDMDFFRKCYQLNPDHDETNLLLLESMMKWFSHCAHEWPSGILYGMAFANKEECEDLHTHIELALTMASEDSQRNDIHEFRQKVILYEEKTFR